MTMKLPKANAKAQVSGIVETGDQSLGYTNEGKSIHKLGVQVPEDDSSTWPTAAIYIKSNSGTGIIYRRKQTNGTFAQFQVNDGANSVGSISCTASTTTYATSSDARLKEDFKPIDNALDTVMLLNPCNFKWKTLDERADGFIAQELEQIVPLAVTKPILEGPEEFNEQGLPKNPWGVDASKLVPLLTKAVQELKGQVDALKEEIAAIKGGN